jgi:uncharacterized membrane protein YfcA
MDFPISGVVINPILLAGIGFLVGILGGFFGVGGGFIAGPFMFWAGVPMNFVVGTDLAHMTGKSIVASKRHRTLGHVDIKLGAFMIISTIIGVEVGAQIIEHLEESGSVDLVIGVIYIFILLMISSFTAWESLRALRMIRSEQIDVKDAVGFQGLARHARRIKALADGVIPRVRHRFYINLDSIWCRIYHRFIIRCIRSWRGIYSNAAVSLSSGHPDPTWLWETDLFEIVFSSGYGTITHALKGNVDFLMALVMQTGAALGAQIGATSTRFFRRPSNSIILFPYCQ